MVKKVLLEEELEDKVMDKFCKDLHELIRITEARGNGILTAMEAIVNSGWCEESFGELMLNGIKNEQEANNLIENCTSPLNVFEGLKLKNDNDSANIEYIKKHFDEFDFELQSEVMRILSDEKLIKLVIEGEKQLKNVTDQYKKIWLKDEE